MKGKKKNRELFEKPTIVDHLVEGSVTTSWMNYPISLNW